MIDFLTILAWFVAILSIYVASYYFLLYFDAVNDEQNRVSTPDVTIAISAYNEERGIYKTLQSLNNSIYPKKKIHVIVVDDKSKDKTINEVKKFIKDNPNFDVTLLKNSKNKGKAYSLNKVMRITKTNFMITMDADSQAAPKAIASLVRYSKGVSVVTPCVLPSEKKRVLARIQAIEYIYSNYLSNILSGFDAQIVAPGPFSMFRVSDLKSIGGFDEKSIAEDLEVVFRLRKKGFKMRLSPTAYVYTDVPQTIVDLVKQRRRWKAGFMDAVQKHPKSIEPTTEFGRQNMLNALYHIVPLVLLVMVVKFTYNMIEPLVNIIRYVGFDPLTYLRTLKFGLDPLAIDMQMVVYTIFMAVMTLMFLYLASKFQDENPKILDALLFIGIYGVAITTATLLAIYSWIKGDYTW
ncbi:MAG: glycosyltransferase family 2 protein [Candidatus Altiarchaeota archaeon]|nr:glycosyltransferase family 2 protein [Candidatus Altiarchaeota archaeon]